MDDSLKRSREMAARRAKVRRLVKKFNSNAYLVEQSSSEIPPLLDNLPRGEGSSTNVHASYNIESLLESHDSSNVNVDVVNFSGESVCERSDAFSVEEEPSSSRVNAESDDDMIETVWYDESESEEEFGKSDELERELVKLVVEENLTEKSTNRLLGILRKFGHPNLPKTRKTLVHTPTSKTVLRPVGSGDYCHFGIENFFIQFPENSFLKNLPRVEIDINIDGIKIFENNKSLWPILGAISGQKEISPFIIGAYYGEGHPTDRDAFLKDFVSEVNHLIQFGVHVTRDKLLKPFGIRFFCCDTPARALICGITGHMSKKSGCSRCINALTQINGKNYYSVVTSFPRTDSSFRGREHQDHHKEPIMQIKGIEKISNLDMINQVVIDPMHAVDLGVTRRLLNIVFFSSTEYLRLSPRGRIEIDEYYTTLSPFIPVEFNRKPRQLSDMAHWKATEYRLFNLYTGMLVFDQYLPSALNDHFLLFYCSLRLMSLPNISPDNLSIAKDLMKRFVEEFPNMYGHKNVVYNIHMMLHLHECVEIYGSLDIFSAYKFENFMQQIKRIIRKKHQVLAQLHHRMEEISAFNISTHSETSEFSGRFNLNFPDFNCSLAYRTCHFSKFQISSNQRDGCCLISVDDTEFVVSVIGFGEYNGVRGMFGRKYLDVTPLFINPINSYLVGISKVSKLDVNAEFFPINLKIRKCMRLPYKNNSFIIIRMLHECD